MAKIGKSSQPFAWTFDTLSSLAFDNVASVGAAVANTTVQARLIVPQRCKIAKVVANYSAIGTGGAHSINVVVGNGADGAVVGADALAIAGPILLASDVDISGAGADVPTVLVPTAPGQDAIFNTGALLTLRCVTPATTGAFTNLKVMLLVALLDPWPALQVKFPAAGTAAVAGTTPVQTVGW